MATFQNRSAANAFHMRAQFYLDTAPLSDLISRTETLSADNEATLIATYQTTQNENTKAEALEKLVVAHLPLLRRMAGNQPYNPHITAMDLLQAGSLGLMTAINRFDSNYGARLATYAVSFIKEEMTHLDSETRGGSMAYPAESHDARTLFRHYSRTCHALKIDPDTALSSTHCARIAKEMSVSPENVRDFSLYYQLCRNPQSLSDEVINDTNSPLLSDQLQADSHADPLVSLAEDNYAAVMHQALQKALTELSPRQREIIEERWLNDDEQQPTLKEIAARHGVSFQAIEQNETKAFRKLRAAFGVAADAPQIRSAVRRPQNAKASLN